MSTIKVNTIQSNTTAGVDVNSPLETVPSIDVTGSASIGGGLNVTGVVTATSFSGALTGNATGLSGTPNITVGTIGATSLNASGVVTATSFSGSGANLTGIGGTTDVRTNSLVVSGITTVAAGSAAAPSITPTGDSDTGIFFPSADTIAIAEGGSEALRIDSSSNLQFNSGYGSVATAYGCRAWVNFNGTSTVAIRASGNVSSITDHGTGDYTVTFTTAMPDADYAATFGTVRNDAAVRGGNFVCLHRNQAGGGTLPASGSLRITTPEAASSAFDAANVDMPIIYVAIFR